MMSGSLFVTLLVCGTAVARFDPMLEQHWQMWKKTHDKIYQTEVEELGRREIWERNLDLISLHNLEASMGMHTYDLGMNHLGDLTQEEVAQSFASLRVPADLKREPSAFLGSSGAPIPDTVDWREKGYVTSVKMQVMINCCQCSSLCLEFQ
ncbi:hypothetical protein DPEC_G00353280 [Dallia pectoralis]|uniref:Uncharacterized protein n=1 Tax=Dallia pectoralis TaxID=75939 RepID=A0ACC2F2B2_DALPE|nr:hypothetical protein DPEC_G00353280 [Dallia pectoralis]